MTRTLYAWEDSGKFYLSAFQRGQINGRGMTPAAVFDDRAALDAEVRRRQCNVEWQDGA